MRKRSLDALGLGWQPPRRVMIAAGVLAALLMLAGAAAWWTGRGQSGSASAPHTGSSAPPKSTSAPAPKPPLGGSKVAGPPPIADPLAFARASAVMLWTFDARTTSRDDQLAGMHTWMTGETAYADWDSVQAQIPGPLLWSRLKDNAQHASATTSEAHFPSAFKQALAENPQAITEAYIYAVTVRGKTQLAWNGGGGGAEDRQVTLAVQCRPGKDCRLAAVAPRVAP
ncbi:hypothetical protein DEJ51_30855 [Streptomyces venezuelae]|uniref:Uncharacterized protein n=1 Tax=Streptomyces venezuelae TaxID=54571 RepID=A0A5P2DZI3_STRVZ|nr:hypothetical protein [Streptomyces venezuelae]QES58009.1 hypothetical protein DEJ51_30855 [Streptomyces venezuelae]